MIQALPRQPQLLLLWGSRRRYPARRHSAGRAWHVQGALAAATLFSNAEAHTAALEKVIAGLSIISGQGLPSVQPGSCSILLSLQWADSQGSFKSSCRRNSPQKQLGDALDERHSSKAEEGQCRLQP